MVAVRQWEQEPAREVEEAVSFSVSIEKGTRGFGLATDDGLIITGVSGTAAAAGTPVGCKVIGVAGTPLTPVPGDRKSAVSQMRSILDPISVGAVVDFELTSQQIDDGPLVLGEAREVAEELTATEDQHGSQRESWGEEDEVPEELMLEVR